MSIEEVMEILSVISDLTEDEMERYRALVEMQFAPYKDMDLCDGDKSRMLLYIAAKANYDITQIRLGDGVTSFKAGDVSIGSNVDHVCRAMEFYLSARDGAADLIEDNGFSFLGV